MNCRRVNLLLGEYRHLDRAERRMVDAHLRGCDACRQARQDEVRVRAAIINIPSCEPTPGLEPRLRAIAASPPPPAAGGPSGGVANRVGWLVAAVVGGVALFVASPWGGPAPGGSPAGSDQAAGIRPAARSAVSSVGRAAGSLPETIVRRRGAVRWGTTAPEVPEDVVAGQGVEVALDAAPTVRLGAAEHRSASRPGADLPAKSVPVNPVPAPAIAIADATSGPVDRPRRADPPAAPPAVNPQQTSTPRPVATQPLASPTPRGCVVITAQVFADLAGAGSLADCPGCDGAWTAGDEALAAELGVVLPAGVQLAVYDANRNVLVEETFDVQQSPMVEHAFEDLCFELPVSVALVNLPPGWATCPVSGVVEQHVDTPGRAQVRFPLTSGCPIATPSATPTATQVTTPMPVGSSEPAPLPASTEFAAGWTATPPVQTATPARYDPPATVPAVVGSPTPLTSPPEPTLVPIRWRPTPSPTPTAKPTAKPIRERPEPGLPRPTDDPPAPPPSPTPDSPVKPRVDRLP
jgi:hypothetical protein